MIELTPSIATAMRTKGKLDADRAVDEVKKSLMDALTERERVPDELKVSEPSDVPPIPAASDPDSAVMKH